MLVNNWEATYFDFCESKLLDIAKSAQPPGDNLGGSAFSVSYFILFILNIAFSESSITADVFMQSSMPLKKAESRQAASIFISAPGTQSSG